MSESATQGGHNYVKIVYPIIAQGAPVAFVYILAFVHRPTMYYVTLYIRNNLK